MWIVRIALNRPYTFIVLAILIVVVGPLTILRTPTDIFPNINIPVVTTVWSYTGLSADEMAARLVTPFERTMATTVNDIEHIESHSLRGAETLARAVQAAERSLALATNRYRGGVVTYLEVVAA